MNNQSGGAVQLQPHQMGRKGGGGEGWIGTQINLALFISKARQEGGVETQEGGVAKLGLLNGEKKNRKQ